MDLDKDERQTLAVDIGIRYGAICITDAHEALLPDLPLPPSSYWRAFDLNTNDSFATVKAMYKVLDEVPLKSYNRIVIEQKHKETNVNMFRMIAAVEMYAYCHGKSFQRLTTHLMYKAAKVPQPKKMNTKQRKKYIVDLTMGMMNEYQCEHVKTYTKRDDVCQAWLLCKAADRYLKPLKVGETQPIEGEDIDNDSDNDD